MRDSLIKILKQTYFDYCEECFIASEDGYKCAPDFSEFFADRLLENGVIVVPCKIGDTVYQADAVRIYELEIFDISLRKGKPYYETESIDFDWDAIGKSVFLTKEEAEKAIAKMKGGAE